VTTSPLAQQLSAKRAEMMASEVEAVALGLFEARSFGATTVEEIASAAGISVRTFYRYFATKEDVLQLRIDQRSALLADALAARPEDEAPLESLRVALVATISAEDLARVRTWCAVIAAAPDLVKGVLGGIQLKSQVVLADFLGERLGLASRDLVPTMLAAAVGGVVQAAHIRWYLEGGDLPAMIDDGLRILERGFADDPRDWSGAR
jgi:AcrR family transcriptional regulator